MAKDSKFTIVIDTLAKVTGIKLVTSLIEGTISKLETMGRVGRKAFDLINTGLSIILSPLRIAGNLLQGIGVALAGAAIEGGRFNIQMARVWTMAGGGISNFRALREEARGLAADFGLARSEIATGMYNALSAGVDRNALVEFMEAAAKVAVADGSEISVAVDGVTTVLNAFGIKADQTAQVVDLMFQTVRQGKTTFGELAANLSNTAGAAAAAEIPLDQILAHIATLTAQGTPTAQATTQIRQSIIGLNKALGDGWAATMSYQEALRKVWEQSGESQTELLKQVGSTEAMMAVLGGVGQNADFAAQKLRAMEDAAGAADIAFQQVDQFREWPRAIESARSALSRLGEIITESIAPVVNDIAAQINQWTSNEVFWEGLRAKLQDGGDKLRAGFLTALEVAGNIKDALASGASGFGTLITASLISGSTLAVNTLVAGIKASLSVWKLVGDIIGSAILQQVLKLDNKLADIARQNALAAMSDDELRSRAAAAGFDLPKQTETVPSKTVGTPYGGTALVPGYTRDVPAIETVQKTLTKEQQTQIITAIPGEQIEGAMGEFSAEMQQVGIDWVSGFAKNMDQLSQAISAVTATDLSIAEIQQKNEEKIKRERTEKETPSTVGEVAQSVIDRGKSTTTRIETIGALSKAGQINQGQLAEDQQEVDRAQRGLNSAQRQWRTENWKSGAPPEPDQTNPAIAAAQAALDAAKAKQDRDRADAEKITSATQQLMQEGTNLQQSTIEMIQMLLQQNQQQRAAMDMIKQQIAANRS